MKQMIAIIALLLALGVTGVFAFFQSRSLETLQGDSTAVVAALEGSSTQAMVFGNASQTALAEAAQSTYTQAAENFNAALATSTEAASISDTAFQNAAATSTEAAIISDAAFRNAAATSTEASNQVIARETSLAESAFATGTALSNAAQARSSQAADEFNQVISTSAAFATESISTQNAAATSASDAQATVQSQNSSLLSTVEASGWAGDGILGESATLADGFKRFTGTSFELALPEVFEGADLNDSPRSFYGLLGTLGLDSTSDFLRDQDENFLFFAIDTDLVNELPRATVSLLRDVPMVESNLGDYLGGAYVGINGNSALIISDVLPVNGQAVGRSILEQTFENSAVRQMQYIFQVDTNFYVLTFTSPLSEFAGLRRVFEQSAETLRIRAE